MIYEEKKIEKKTLKHESSSKKKNMQDHCGSHPLFSDLQYHLVIYFFFLLHCRANLNLAPVC